jgi:hypothetical protein
MLSLAGEEQRGYGIMHEVRERTAGRVRHVAGDAVWIVDPSGHHWEIGKPSDDVLSKPA